MATETPKTNEDKFNLMDQLKKLQGYADYDYQATRRAKFNLPTQALEALEQLRAYPTNNCIQ
jgi:hypothetical protein